MQENETVLQHHRRRSVDVVCRRCRSKNVVTSRYRGFEGFLVSVLPFNICRCVDCYRRFWAVESIFANTRRVWVWSFVLFFIVAFILLKMQLSEQSSNFNRSAELILPFDDQLEVDRQIGEALSPDTSLSEVLTDVDFVAADNTNSELELEVNQSDNVSQLSDAKAQSKINFIAQKESKARLENAIDDKGALESLVKVEMSYRIERWRSMWESGLVDYYLDFYSQKFQPNSGLPFSEWVVQRKERVTPEKKIRLELSNFDVSFSDNMKETVMVFDQLYSSQTYSGTSRKKLVWAKEVDEWKIVSETELKQ